MGLRGITFSPPFEHMTSSSCHLTIGSRSFTLGAAILEACQEPLLVQALSPRRSLPALIEPPSPRFVSDTTCNVPTRAIGRTGSTYPNGPTRTSQEVTHPWATLAQARLTSEFFNTFSPKGTSWCCVPSLLSSIFILTSF